jgi:glycosyltransferase involved in cell wall biosynthesis
VALQEIVIYEKTGLLCDEDPSELTAAIFRMLDDLGFRHACARQAMQGYESCYSRVIARRMWLALLVPGHEIAEPSRDNYGSA